MTAIGNKTIEAPFATMVRMAAKLRMAHKFAEKRVRRESGKGTRFV